MPCSTWTRARAAQSIQSTVRPSARRASSAAMIEVADQVRRAGHDQQQVFNQAAEGAQQVDGLLLAVGAGAIALRGVEELRIVRFAQGGAQQDERVLAAGEIDAEVDGEGAAHGALGQAGGKGAVLGLSSGRRRASRDSRSAGQRAETMNHGAGADGGQQLLGVFSEQDQRSVLGRLFENFEQAVGRLFHECRRGEDGEGAVRTRPAGGSRRRESPGGPGRA